MRTPLFALSSCTGHSYGTVVCRSGPLEKVRVSGWAGGRSSSGDVQAPQLLVPFLGSFEKAITK